ncbi:methyltransferase domain-containing protein [Halovenus sp. WSH3]|uniref:Methyltransferase domain-containing protein n=1 Tax=Halovenus carboxidivorans TaxID=2692199 RepID=A0A6B0TBV0_9EURY|nr:class I SAM-dependent methyltransferase family protein [Halovenus carboxidivorans]MXR52862.1 methyltransferase domain-containing protein [Halovenus carboxidivorans]
MTVPCVRVPREDGEATRQALAEVGVVDQRHEITHEDGQLYIPVSDPDRVPEGYPVVDYDAPERELQTTPDELVDFSASYERLGEVIIIDEDDPDRARALADAIVDSDLPVKTVLNRASKIRGEQRVRDWEILVGEETEAVHREYGCEFALDLAAVYFSPRLATERHRVVEQIGDDEQVLDMFAGVGPFTIPAAKRGAAAVGVDINETAIEYLRENAERNGVSERVTAICGDVREVAGEYEGWADRLVMNLPHSADEFVETAVRLAGEECVVHYYDIEPEDDLFGAGERAIREAAEPEYEVTVRNRHTVRSYAPHEYNVVLDIELSRA